jgi:hypothetical protein
MQDKNPSHHSKRADRKALFYHYFFEGMAPFLFEFFLPHQHFDDHMDNAYTQTHNIDQIAQGLHW